MTENIEGEIIEADKISSKIIETLTQMGHVVESFEGVGIIGSSSAHVTPPTEHGGEDPINTSICTETDRGRAKPKLLKLILLKFSGDITRFRSFWDSFKSAVDNNEDLSPIDKLIICKPLLRVQLRNVYRAFVYQKQTIQLHYKYWKNILGNHSK